MEKFQRKQSEQSTQLMKASTIFPDMEASIDPADNEMFVGPELKLSVSRITEKSNDIKISCFRNMNNSKNRSTGNEEYRQRGTRQIQQWNVSNRKNNDEITRWRHNNNMQWRNSGGEGDQSYHGRFSTRNNR